MGHLPQPAKRNRSSNTILDERGKLAGAAIPSSSRGAGAMARRRPREPVAHWRGMVERQAAGCRRGCWRQVRSGRSAAVARTAQAARDAQERLAGGGETTPGFAGLGSRQRGECRGTFRAHIQPVHSGAAIDRLAREGMLCAFGSEIRLESWTKISHNGNKMKCIRVLATWCLIATAGFGTPPDAEPGPASVATAAATPMPYEPCVSIRVSEVTNGSAIEPASFSLPIANEETAARIKLGSGNLKISASARVRLADNSRIAAL